ncbi:MAG: NAD(P)-dependent oxidoreductase, partial [bacterium]
LVTGACGFTGSHMLELLTEEGKEIRATDLAGADRSFVESMGVEFIPSDITRRETLDEVFKDVDYVFHIAALLDFASPWSILKKVNVDGTRNVCEACLSHGIKRVVVWSTGGVYGIPDSDMLPITEDTPKRPFTNYEKSKLMEERLAMKYHREKGLGVTVIRPGGAIYGPRQIKWWVEALSLLSKIPFPILLPEFENRVALPHVRDIVGAAYQLCMTEEANGEAYNVGGEVAYTQSDFGEYFLGLLGKKVVRINVPVNKKLVEVAVKAIARANKVVFDLFKPKSYMLQPDSILYSLNDYWFSNEKLKSTGYELKYPDPKEGMRETIEWYRSEGYI